MPTLSQDFNASSNLKRLEWDEGRLRAFFANGNVYAYADVPQEVYEEIVKSTSAGKAFHRLVRTKSYKFAKEPAAHADPAANHDRSDDLGARGHRRGRAP